MVKFFKLLFYPFIAISSFFGNFFKNKDVKEGPLLLTPLIQHGDILEAQRLAKVMPIMDDVQSYAGYLTVEEGCGNNLFFWFILAEVDWERAPVILWLNGGPGGSSMFGLFQEIGPWKIIKGKLVKNNSAWTKHNNVLFIDQPVGTGFSFSEKGCYTKTMKDISEQLYSALVQFFTMFPKLQQNRFFMTGMSFAGHYVPETAMMIDRQKTNSKVNINLAGIVIGSPGIQYTCQYKGDHLFELGVVDEHERSELKSLDDELVAYINSGDYPKASVVDYKITMKRLEFGLPSYNNIMIDKEESFTFNDFITDDDTRRRLHVGETPYEVISMNVFGNLQNAYYSSQAPAVEYLLKRKYVVGFFNGQLDTICSYSALMCVISGLQWGGVQDYTSATRYPWYISGRLAGWFKVSDNLFTVLVRNAGHHVAIDQAEAALAIITAVVVQPPGTPLLSTFETTK